MRRGFNRLTGFALLLSLLELIFALSPVRAEQVKIGIYTVDISEIEGPNDIPRIHIDMSPFDLYSNYLRDEVRNPKFHPGIIKPNPNGPRQYWEWRPSTLVAEFQDIAKFIANDKIVFDLHAQSFENWELIRDLPRIVRHYLEQTTIYPYFKKYEIQIKQFVKDSGVGEPLYSYDRKLKTSNAIANFRFYLSTLHWYQDKPFGLVQKTANPSKLDLFFTKWLEGENLLPMVKHIRPVDIISAKRPLVVVHASQAYDYHMESKAGIDAAIDRSKMEKEPIIFLMEEDGVSDLSWFTDNRNPDYIFYSLGGEHDLRFTGDEAVVVGGFFGESGLNKGCHRATMSDLITRHFLNHLGSLTLHLPADAIYYYDDSINFRKKMQSYTGSDKEAHEIVERMIHQLFDPDYPSYFGSYHDEFREAPGLLLYKFTFYVNGRRIKRIGSPLGRSVNIKLWTSAERIP